MSMLDSLKPGVPRRALFFIAAAVWLAAGSMLLYRGGQSLHGNCLLFTGGIAAGLLFFRFLFIRIATRHIVRIRSIAQPRPCLFSFLDWRGYGLTAVMISGGILVRTAGILPLPVLETLYVGMGTPLLLSAIRFASRGIDQQTPL
jgi:hypothetical protein